MSADQLVVLEHRHREKGSRAAELDYADDACGAVLVGLLLATSAMCTTAFGPNRRDRAVAS